MSPKLRELLIFLGVVCAALAFVFFGVLGRKSNQAVDPQDPIKKRLNNNQKNLNGLKNNNKNQPNKNGQNVQNNAQAGGNNQAQQNNPNNGNANNNGNQQNAANANGQGGDLKTLPDWAYHNGKVETLGGAIVVGVDYLISRSQQIVVGQVLATKARLTKDKQFIVTDVTIAVDQNLKGDVQGDTMTVQIIGGTLEDGTTLSVTHQPTFLPGDEGFFFVDKKDPTRLTELAANAQGFLRVDRPSPDSQVVRDGFNRMVYDIEEKGHLGTNSQNGTKKRVSAKAMSDYIEKRVKAGK